MVEQTSPVAVSAEQYAHRRGPSGEVGICFQTFGDPTDEPLLLVMGLAGPMTWWEPELCLQLAEAGFFVIRYDNRDTGRSSRVGRRPRQVELTRAFLTGRARENYSISDMAQDGLAVLDTLGIDAAHLAGVSMGGMIAQTMTIEHPDRVLSLTSIMSTTGSRRVGWQHPSLLPNLALRRSATKDDYIAGAVSLWKMIGSPAHPVPEEKLHSRAADTWDRGFDDAGAMRQILAILTQPDRTRALRDVRVPTTVVHGLADKMVHVSGARATAKAIPGAELRLIPGFGHDLPPALYPEFVSAIRNSANRTG